MTMCLCRARRFLLRPSPLTPGGLDSAEHGVLKFMNALYKVVNHGHSERLRRCRFMFATLLDSVPNIKKCGLI